MAVVCALPALEYFEMDFAMECTQFAGEDVGGGARRTRARWRSVKVSAEEGLRARNWHDWNESGRSHFAV